MNNSPYLDLPLFPLAVVLTPMLEKIETKLPTAGPVEKYRLQPSRVDPRAAHAEIDRTPLDLAGT